MNNAFVNKGWGQMELLLNEHMPVTRKRRYAAYGWIAGIAVIGLIAYGIFALNQKETESQPVSELSINQKSDQSVAEGSRSADQSAAERSRSENATTTTTTTTTTINRLLSLPSSSQQAAGAEVQSLKPPRPPILQQHPHELRILVQY